MAATQLGTATSLAAVVSVLTVPNAANYTVESVTEGRKNVDMEDTFDANGARITRTIYNKNRIATMTLICMASAAPLTDFPEGTMVATNWYVNSAPVTKTKSPWRVEVELEEIFITT